MSVQIGPARQQLDSERYYAFSGLLQAGAAQPATLTLIDIPDTGLRNSIVQIQPFFGLPVTTAANEGLGTQILIDDVIVFEQKSPDPFYRDIQSIIQIPVPKNSKLTVLSLNTNGNSTQSRGANLIGYYI